MECGRDSLSNERSLTRTLELDCILERLFPGEIVVIPSSVTYSARIRDALAPHICSLRSMGISVVLDFPANTRNQRSWLYQLCLKSGAEHELHFIDAPDDVRKRQLGERSKGLPAGARWTTDADCDAITAYFDPPAADERFNVIQHTRD